MLVLTRKVGERIQLGDNITITLVKINGSVVRLGIDAPRNMAVVRQELGEPKSSQPAAAFEPEALVLRHT